MKSNRKPSVELLRIIACFFVVALHAAEDIIDISTNNLFDFFINTILQNSVTIFWLISGFFIFHSKYKDLLTKTFKKIWLPTFVVSIICVVLYDVYLNITDGVELQSISTYLFNFVYNALRFRTFAPSCRHFWYIYTYCLVILAYPILFSFVKYLDQDKKRQKIFVYVSLLLMLVNEITLNEFAGIENHGFSAMCMASIEVIFGHIVYENKEYYINKIKSPLCVFVLFLIVNILKCSIYILAIRNGIASSNNVYWYSVFSVATSILLFALCEKLTDNSKDSKINLLLSNVGSLTFGVYMFHKIPIKVFGKLGAIELINGSGSILRYALMFLYFIACFIVALIISAIYNKLLDLVVNKKKC